MPENRDLAVRSEVENDASKLRSQLEKANERLEKASTQLIVYEESLMLKEEQIKNMKSAISIASDFSVKLLKSKFYQLYHLQYRFIGQFLFGTMADKKNFLRWIKHLGKNPDIGAQYNFARAIYNTLQLSPHFKSFTPVSREKLLTLKQLYAKQDIIILSIIPFSFRYQRPQHFADRFAKNGHRVFYVDCSFTEQNNADQIDDNLYTVSFKNKKEASIYSYDWSNDLSSLYKNIDWMLAEFSIYDAAVVVDFPNWLHTARYLKEQCGFKFVTDYMDDFTGFSNTGDTLTKDNCIALLQESDAVIASSQFLVDSASKYNSNVHAIRNGTDFSFFATAANGSTSNQRKIIGYYGAVAEWFDYEKILYLAEKLPNADIIIIGNVTLDKGIVKRLEAFENIKLMGEKPYTELPDHLKDFDVCLIPFVTDTELILATNPVKFYEYISAGKKIVATEIPELFPYKDEYVYLANDNESFLSYVELCLNGDDTLKHPKECMEFGKENDWNCRFYGFSEICGSLVPKVSIIMLTYNGLKMNKICVNSILTNTAYQNYELIIVDNMSTDGTRDYLTELDEKGNPNIKIILNNDNKGFAGGNNVGIRAADGDYIILLNNDTLVTRGWITNLIKHMENNSNIGMTGSVTNSIGNEAEIPVKYNSFESMLLFADKFTRKNMGKTFDNPNVLAMFCVAIRRKVIDECGLLDEDYTRGMFEDDDYADRVKKAGYKLLIADDSFIHHFGSATFKKLESKEFMELFNKNKEIFVKKSGHKWIPHKKRPEFEHSSNHDMLLDIDDVLFKFEYSLKDVQSYDK